MVGYHDSHENNHDFTENMKVHRDERIRLSGYLPSNNPLEKDGRPMAYTQTLATIIHGT